MKMVIISDLSQRNEINYDKENCDIEIIWLSEIDQLASHLDADIYLDLLFHRNEERIQILKAYSSKIIIINSVIDTLFEMNLPFIRINGWPGFLHSSKIEAAGNKNEMVQTVFKQIGKEIIWLPDLPGFISARIICKIINESLLAAEENVSSQKEIDVAMKLGTNYPLGPFEWLELIGRERITGLLKKINP